MDITFRLSGPWGPGKGTNLAPAEVDNNFWSLAQAIVDLQNDPSQPVGIASISVSGTQMTITLTDGSVQGPFTLPVLTFRWRGEWQPDTAYAELDVVSVTNTGIFMVLVDHTSGSTFDPALVVGGLAAYLQLFGSTDASLSGLSDVLILDPLLDGDALVWGGAKWQNTPLGSMAYQNRDAVSIIGGSITGMASPVDPTDVVNKAYVDALPAGMTSPTNTMMSNISGAVAPAIPNTLSNFLDAAFAASTRGTIIYRGGSGWVALAPGTSGFFLKTLGSGADPIWAAGGAGVTSVTAGSGISTGGAPITATGIVSLAAIADKNLLANTSGASAPPSAMTLSALLDAVLTNVRGSVLTRAGGGWVGLAPGTSGYFLRTNGSGADVSWDAPAGSGTVTSVATGAGLTGGPITGAGTISLAQVADKNLLANISGSTAAPGAVTVSQLLDSAIAATQGALLYRSATAWVAITPGTAGQILTTGGASANPAWAAVPSGAPIATGLVVGNISGSTAAPTGISPTSLFDAVFGSTRGMVLYRGASGWVTLAAGTSGQVLTTGGSAADPAWATPAAGGASVTIGTTPPASPAAGDLWWDSSDGSGQLFVWFNDGTSSQWVIANSGAGTAAAAKYNIGFSFTGGVLGASQLLGMHRASKAITIPANFGSVAGHASQAGGTANATASTVISVDRALSASPTSFSQVGTITIAAGGIAATFATSGGAAVSVAQGDVLRLVGPVSPDATLANFYATLVAQET